MGIKGLNKLISQFASSAISLHNIDEFCGSKVAIDGEILIHKFRTVESKNSHIFGFLNNIFWHLRHGIIPIYVFDGAPNIAKQTNVLSKRLSFKEHMYQKAEELENKFVEQLDNIDNTKSTSVLSPEINDTLDQLFKIQRKMSFMTVTKNHRNECKYLLKLMGIPFIVANEDAEALCVSLHRKGQVDYIYTEDTDAITYFAASLVTSGISTKNIKILRKGFESLDNDMVTVIDLNRILIDMELTPKSFVDMCILSGSDFCPTIPKIGPIKAYNYIKKYESLENFGMYSGITIPEDFKYQEARNIFYRDHCVSIEKSLNLEPLKHEDLKKYLFEERSLNPIPIIDKYRIMFNIFKGKTQAIALMKQHDPFCKPDAF